MFLQVVFGAPNDGKELADRFGEDLNFASKQVIRGFTAIFAPILDTAQSIPRVISKAVPGGGNAEANQNFQQVLFRDGLNALGKGIKASSTILSSPARVLGTGLDEARKAGQAGVDARFGADKPAKSVPLDDRSKIVSTLLNTTSSELSQANLGAVLIEVALKNRVKDIVNRTAEQIVPKKIDSVVVEKRESPASPVSEGEEPPTTTSRVDVLLNQFSEAVKRNDERLLELVKSLIAVIDPKKN